MHRLVHKRLKLFLELSVFIESIMKMVLKPEFLIVESRTLLGSDDEMQHVTYASQGS